MRKMFAVVKREYLQAVRKKMFVIMTILFPVLMAGAFTLPTIIAARGLGEKKVVVVDGTGRLSSSFTKTVAPPRPKIDDSIRGRRAEVPQLLTIDYVDASGIKDFSTAEKPFLSRLGVAKGPLKADGVFIIPPDAIDGTNVKMKFYSRSAADLFTQVSLSNLANHGIERLRLTGHGINGDQVDALTREVPVDAIQLSRSGEQKKGGQANLLLALLFGWLLLMPSFVYGIEIMRGIIQEKNDRVVEVLVSSMSPRQLLTGKILGIAAVGLTQISAWLIMLALIGGYAAAAATFAGFDVAQFIHPSLFVYFICFFLLAYLTYVCIYAITGAICNSDREAQQLMGPIMILIMLPWFLMFPIITNPDSSLAVGFSIAPLFGPVTMFVRTLVSDPPILHVIASMAVSIVTVLALFWTTAKIFRIGILSYGKRPTLSELWQWLKIA